VADITAIYNHYVLHSEATFDTEQKSVEDRTAWLESHDANHPVLVAERRGTVCGWGSVSPWGTRPGWRHTVELSVYVDASATRAGLGPLLLDELVDACRRVGHHALMAQIVADNTASLKMVERAGFQRVGTLVQVGRKFDRWLDLALVELVLEG
jgi:phosphinothricin acetyltransferase